MKAEIVPADPVFRRRVMGAIMVLGLLGAAAIFALHHALQGVAQAADGDLHAAIEKVRYLQYVFLTVNACISVPLAAWCARAGWSTWHHARFPPPGMRVLRDTPVRTGPYARLAAAAQWLVAIAVLSTNLLLLRIMSILQRLLEQT